MSLLHYFIAQNISKYGGLIPKKYNTFSIFMLPVFSEAKFYWYPLRYSIFEKSPSLLNKQISKALDIGHFTSYFGPTKAPRVV